MSLITITDAQRYAIGYRCGIAANLTQRFVNDTRKVTEAQAADIETAITNLVAALEAAGYAGTPEGSALLADGATVSVVNSAGNDAHNATANVTGTTLDNVQLVLSTAALVDHTDATEIRRFDGSILGITTATARVADGLLSNVRLPYTADAVLNGSTYSVRNSAGADAHSATALVASNGVLTGFNLAATVAMVDNGDALTIPVTGTYTKTVTFAVSAGAITGITLS